MSNGYVLKLLESIKSAGDTDLNDQLDAAIDMVQHGYDANDDQWTALNNKVKDREQKSQGARGADGQAGEQTGRDAGASVVQGTRGHQQYVSNKEPGTLGNQIGYPGTEQDQDGPGKKNRNVPGVKPPKDEKK